MSAVRRQSFEDRNSERAEPRSLAEGHLSRPSASISPRPSTRRGLLVRAGRVDRSKLASCNYPAHHDCSPRSPHADRSTMLLEDRTRPARRTLDRNRVLVRSDPACSVNPTGARVLR